MIAWIDEAGAAGARLSRVGEVLEISPRTLQRWREHGDVKADGRKAAGAQRVPANKLAEHERRQVLDIANAPEFADLPPSQIVPTLADQGRYIASESSFYRVLREADQKTPAQIELDILDYATRARDGKIQLEDLRVPHTNILGKEGGGFAIANDR